MKERWHYMFAEVAHGCHPAVDGKRCYWYFRGIPGGGRIIKIIPVDEFWP